MRAGIVVLAFFLLSCQSKKTARQTPSKPAATAAADPKSTPKPKVAAANPPKPTAVVMHNVILQEDDGLNLRIRWLRGSLYPTNERVTPSFDDRNSFWVGIEAATVGISLADLTKLLNSGVLRGTPLSNVTLSEQGKLLKVTGILHKGVPLPFEMISDPGVTSDGRIVLRAQRIRVLKIPVGGLLRELHITASDLIGSTGSKGMQAEGNAIYIDPEKVLPPPRKHGTLISVHLNKGDMVEVFGNARDEAHQVKEWRNFMQLSGGNFAFGRLMMYGVDMTLVDSSSDTWFELDLTHYQEQLVNGYAHLTPSAGLQIFMPDASKVPNTRGNRTIMAQWMKNRYLPMPAGLAP